MYPHPYLRCKVLNHRLVQHNVADEGRVVGDRSKAKERCEEVFCDAICVGGERAIPNFPRGVGMVKGKVI